MYKYLRNEEIDYVKWDNCMHSSKHGHIFALSFYLDVVSPGWEAIVDEGEGEYTLIFPIAIQEKLGIKYAYQPLYVHYLGIISINELKDDDYKTIGELLRRHIKLIANYSFNIFNSSDQINKYFGPLHNSPQTTHLIDLNENYPVVYSRFKDDQKRKLKKANSKYIVEESNNITVLLNLFRKYTHHRIFMKSEESYGLLEMLYDQLLINDMCKLYYSIDKETYKAEAGALFLIFKKHIMIFISSVSDQGKTNGAAVQLINHVLQAYSGQGYIFDFKAGGKVESLHRFFRSFGGTEATFSKIRYNHLPFPIPQIRNLRIAFYEWLYPREED
jgi:hypothetical protein